MIAPANYGQTCRYPCLAINLFLVSLLLFLSGCQSRYHASKNPGPIPQFQHSVPQKPMNVALVLGGGGSRGMAHVGVLEEFEKAGIPISLIVGCSSGSLVGALYADRPDALFVKETLEPLKRRDLMDYRLLDFRYGFVRGTGLRLMLRSKLRSRRFEELKVPLIVVATDLLEGELVTIGGGEVVPAVHASCAIPLYFQPVEAYGRILVDGAVIDPVPVKVAKLYNPKVVIAVDLSALLAKELPRHLLGVAMRSWEISFRHQSMECMKGADVIIRPNIGDVGLFDDQKTELTYEAGKLAAREWIPKIKELLRQRAIETGSPLLLKMKTKQS